MLGAGIHYTEADFGLFLYASEWTKCIYMKSQHKCHNLPQMSQEYFIIMPFAQWYPFDMSFWLATDTRFASQTRLNREPQIIVGISTQPPFYFINIH